MPSNEYWAGFFDGEGSVSISHRGNVQIKIAQKYPEILMLAKEQFGGNVGKKDRKYMAGYHWTLCGKEKMSVFLKSIHPHTIVKREDISLGLEVISMLRQDNKGCNPLPEKEFAQRMELRNKLLSKRPRKHLITLASMDTIYRNSIKEKYAYECSECGYDLKEKSPFNVIVSDDRLFCRKCNQNRHAREFKVIPKEDIVKAVQDTKNLDDAAKMLGLSRQGLLRKRRKYGLLEYLCQVCHKPYQPSPRSSHRYCSDECGDIGKQYLLEQRQTAYHDQKILNNRKYYHQNKEKLKEKLRSKKFNP